MSVPEPPTILAIHAHPDDIEIQCFGTLLKLRQLGCPITIVTMTPGDGGSEEHGAEQIAAIRRQEAAAAARLIDAEYMCLEFRDLSIVFDNESRRRVTECLRKVRPQIVLTAPAVDYMHDHEITSQLVRDACFNASVPNYKTRLWDPAPITSAIPHLYYVDAVEGVDHFGNRHPIDFAIDVSSQMDTKIQALACHSSQRDWLRKQHGVDEYLDACRRWSQQRGSEMGVEYAEGFRQHKGHPYPQNNLLAELLKTDCHQPQG